MGDRRGTVFFDYDGTLHDTMALYGPAFRAACAWLSKEGWLERRTYADADIACWLGWTNRGDVDHLRPASSRARVARGLAAGARRDGAFAKGRPGPAVPPVSRRPSMR